MLHELDGVEGRSRVEGEGQVEWARSGPGPALPRLSQRAAAPRVVSPRGAARVTRARITGLAIFRRLLRSLLDIALDDERFASLASRIGPARRSTCALPARSGRTCWPRCSTPRRRSPAARSWWSPPTTSAARDLARGLGAYLAPRRVRYYPSRGTGYESHLAPPPHLVGLRIGALDALTSRRANEQRANDAPVVVASAVALAEAVPDASLRPEGFALHRGEEVDLGDVAELLVEAGYERIEQVEERGQFAIRGGILDVFPATEERAARLELFGDEIESIRWFSTFTQRSLGDAERIELDPAAELALEHRELAELGRRRGGGRAPRHRRAAAGRLVPRAARPDRRPRPRS